jgi:hypothetical protein
MCKGCGGINSFTGFGHGNASHKNDANKNSSKKLDLPENYWNVIDNIITVTEILLGGLSTLSEYLYF